MRYTFAVCENCGVQSQPVLLPKTGSVQDVILQKLNVMGWQVRSFNTFNSVRAVCPACLLADEEARNAEAKIAS